MQLAREDIVIAAENIDLYEDDYSIYPDYSGQGMAGRTCLGIVLPVGKLTPFMVALALILAEQGREDDALRMATETETGSKGFGTVAYWRGVQLAD